MTCRESMRDEAIEDMMVDAGLWHAPDVKATLGVLAALAALKAPQPASELAAMLSGGTTAAATAGRAGSPESAASSDGAISVEGPATVLAAVPAIAALEKQLLPKRVDELAQRRRLRRARTVIVGVAVVAAMGMGVSGVAAATGGLPHGSHFISKLISQLAPVWAPELPPVQPIPAPDSPGVSSVPSQEPATPGTAYGEDGNASTSKHGPDKGSKQAPDPAANDGGAPGKGPAGLEHDNKRQGGQLDKAVKSPATVSRTTFPTVVPTSTPQSPVAPNRVNSTASTVTKSLPSWLLGLTK